MAIPSIFPMFLKAKLAGGAGTVLIETIDLELLDPIDVEVIRQATAEIVSVEAVGSTDPIEVELETGVIEVEVETP